MNNNFITYETKKVVAKKQCESIFFTVVEPYTNDEYRIFINFYPDFICEPVTIEFPKKVSMDSQQLAELGHLLIALSQHDYDEESIYELIDGYGYSQLFACNFYPTRCL